MFDTQTQAYLDEAARRIETTLAGVVGIYLHGSAVLGGYDPRSDSDIDILVVAAAAVPDAQKQALASLLSEESLPCPAAGGLEMSVVTAASAAQPVAAPAYELHVRTAASGRIAAAARDAAVPDAHKLSLAALLSPEPLPSPAAGGVDMGIVTAAAAAHPVAAAAPTDDEAHMMMRTTTATQPKVVPGGTDADLVLHFAVCRQGGQNLASNARGDAAREDVFGEVPRELILSQLRDELVWARAEAGAHYAVLNAGRAWRYVEEGKLVSKFDGALWVLQRSIADAHLVMAAMARQTGGGDEVDREAARGFVNRVLKKVQGEMK